jgi:lipopolysaccharide/colanic/teichoic acid biosynthesis glycosyltransferase
LNLIDGDTLGMKRLFDFVVSFFGLVITSPILIPTMIAVWWQDYHSPFYIAPRVGKGEKLFRMVKMRSMVMNADKSGVDSTGANDNRITAVGRFVRSYKIDELTQLWNVLKGDMSLVGPRPNVKRETDLYTSEEKRLLSVRPGITDISSIVFADEGDILKDSEDPDLDYNQLIRPWKSRLGLLYVDNSSLILDILLILLTVIAIISRENSLNGVQKVLLSLHAEDKVRKIAARQEALYAFPPPGALEIVNHR